MIKDRNPDIYHGRNKKPVYFEGWYFKIVQVNTGLTYCFIPGEFRSHKEENSHSFIQILNGDKNSFTYVKYNKDEFKASNINFKLKVGDSYFSSNKIIININQKDENIHGTLYFNDIIKWPDNMINPGSMGFYNYLHFMQCYSQVCVIDGTLVGTLEINGKLIDFTGGKLYIEKNWGQAFPYSYIWLQSNNFKKGNGSVTCSIGHIPFPIKSFTGFLIGLYVNGRLYKFTTMNRSSIFINPGNHEITIKAFHKNYALKMVASYKEDTFMDLYAPHNGQMVPIAHESLCGTLVLTLFDTKRRAILYHDKCSSAGIEFSKNYAELIMKINSK